MSSEHFATKQFLSRYTEQQEVGVIEVIGSEFLIARHTELCLFELC